MGDLQQGRQLAGRLVHTLLQALDRKLLFWTSHCRLSGQYLDKGGQLMGSQTGLFLSGNKRESLGHAFTSQNRTNSSQRTEFFSAFQGFIRAGSVQPPYPLS